MARRRVTYLEVADRPAGPRPQPIDLERGTGRHAPPAPADRPVRLHPRWLALAAALVVLVGWVGRPAGSPSAVPDAREDARRTAPDGAGTDGPVVIRSGHVTAGTWRGVLEHHPGSGEPDLVDRVHVVALATDSALPDRSANALLVVDATRRAFGGPDARWQDVSAHVRLLGLERGRGLRTLQWDVDGYGLALTTVGLDLADQQRLAAAVRLPAGPSLLNGLAPDVEAGTLVDLGLGVTHRRSGPGRATGSPLIGQSGGASIDGQLHQHGSHALLISVVEGQVVDAEMIRRALGPAVAVTPRGVSRVTAAAALAHPGPAPADRRIRGWNRLVLDHGDGVTVELSSDQLGADELAAAAAAIDLDRLARTAVPMR